MHLKIHVKLISTAAGDYKEVYCGKKKDLKFSQKLPPGSQNLFRVRARNAVGWSEFSEDTIHSVGQAPPPAPPPPSLSTCSSHSLSLHWTTPPGPGRVTSYCLEMDDPDSVSLSSLSHNTTNTHTHTPFSHFPPTHTHTHRAMGSVPCTKVTDSPALVATSRESRSTTSVCQL